MVAQALLYPTPKDLLEMELATIKFLRNDNQVRGDFCDLAVAASRVTLATKRPMKQFPRQLTFGSHMLLDEPCGGLRIDIGVKIEVDEAGDEYRNLSYFFAVSHANAKDGFRKVLRKMHFDHAPYNPNAHTAHPFSHMQYAGTLPPCMSGAGFTDNSISHMNPRFEGPRIPCAPVSLAILIHLLLREFPDTKGAKLIERLEWRSRVRSNEKLLLTDFHKACSRRLNERNGLISDLFYYDR